MSLLYVGIDISKDLNYVTGIYTPKNKAFYSVIFENSPVGFAKLDIYLRRLKTKESMIICMESTGVYGEKLCHYLYNAGYTVHVEPPQYVRRAFRLKRKTDRVDSLMIAEYAYRYSDQLHLWKPQDALIEQIRIYLNNREIYQKEQTAHKNMLKAISHKEETALEHSHTDTIEFLHTKIKDLDDNLVKLIQWKADKNTQTGFEMLLTIPGVGWLWAFNFFIVTEGFHQLNYRQIASYLGLVPYEYTSGTTVIKNPKTDRSGPDQFRKLLYLSAISVCRVGKFKTYFQQKKAEGKNGKLILNNIQNKLLKIACACVRDKKPYHEGHRSINPLKAVK